MPAALAAPARFDASAAPRRAMIAKLHVARRDLGLTEDDYRAVLFRVTDRTSAKDCSDDELRDALEEFKRLGFRPLPARLTAPKAPRPADHPAARKARALWISLAQLGAIENPSEAALEAFARRQLGVDRMQWANQALMYKLVEGLKAIAERHGWSQDLAGIPRERAVKTLKLRLCEALLARLVEKGLADAGWDVGRAAFMLNGFEGNPSTFWWTIGDLDEVSQGFAAKLRAAR